MISFLKNILCKFKYAFHGLFHGFLHDKSIALQYSIGIIVIVVCMFLPMKEWEWCMILSLIALVITLEYINSAIEHIVDFVCPEYHEQAKIIKDYCAAAVLVISIFSAIIGIIIIGGKL